MSLWQKFFCAVMECERLGTFVCAEPFLFFPPKCQLRGRSLLSRRDAKAADLEISGLPLARPPKGNGRSLSFWTRLLFMAEVAARKRWGRAPAAKPPSHSESARRPVSLPLWTSRSRGQVGRPRSHSRPLLPPQACIDDNVDMVTFLVEHGASIDQPDNEGWLPLHAAASCGYLDIAA